MKTNENVKDRRPFTLCCGLLAVSCLMIPGIANAALDHTEVTLWAAFDGATKVTEQSSGPVITESQAPSPGNNPWTWIVSDVTGFLNNPNFSFSVLNANGTQARLQWDAFDDSDWLTSGGLNGSFTLRLRNNQDPDIVYGPIVNPFKVSLRRINTATFTVFEGQTGGGDLIPSSDTGSYSFAAPPASFTGIDSSLGLAFTGRGAISVSDPGTVAWTEDGTFTLRITHGTRPFADIAGLPLRLRKLAHNEFVVFEGQTGGGDAVATGTYGFAVAPGSFTGIDSSLALAFTSKGAISVEDPGTVAWNEDGTFGLRISPSNAPYCDIRNMTLHLRRIISNPLAIPDNGRAGSINLQVQGDVGPWDWFDYEDGLANSVLMAPDSFDSSSLAISWAAGAVESDESGTGSVTIQRSNGSSPASTVNLETAVVEAPPLPVSYWPVLAAMLAVLAVALMKRGTTSPVH